MGQIYGVAIRAVLSYMLPGFYADKFQLSIQRKYHQIEHYLDIQKLHN